jgi:hypothetical protein
MLLSPHSQARWPSPQAPIWIYKGTSNPMKVDARQTRRTTFANVELLSLNAARRWRHDPSQAGWGASSSGSSINTIPKSFARASNVSSSSSDVVWDISPAGPMLPGASGEPAPMSIVNCRERRLRPCDDSSVLAYTLKRFGTVRSVIAVRSA